jgi:hypothetical protein
MKKIKYKVYRCMIALCLVALASCDLDEYNPSGASADEVWTTPQGFVTAINAAYSPQREWYGKEDGLFMSESGTDLWFNREKNGYARQLSQYDGLSADQGSPNRAGWRILYQAINVCNAGIERIGSAGFVDDAERNRREGELRFLRGFYYWHVVETYGNVILRTHETKTPELTATRSSIEDFYTQIFADLELAAEYLPNEWGNEYSRATKKSALGFLARAYLSRAYYATGADRDLYFTKARDVASEVISRQAEFSVRLWPNYADLWNPANNKNLGKKDGEALYVVSNSTDPTLNFDLDGNRIHTTFLTRYVGMPGLQLGMEYGYENDRRLMPTRALLNFFDESMDARYAGSFQEVWLANKNYTWTTGDATTYLKSPGIVGEQLIAGVDTAMYITKKHITNEKNKTYVVVDIDSAYAADGKIRSGRDYVALKKYLDTKRTTAASRAGFNDIAVMRLAEMYLIAAEAEFQLGHSPAAADLINVLRTRAAIKIPVDHTSDMQVDASDVTLDFILDERARELAGEHIRWFDLKRTGKLLDRVHQYNPDITKIQPFHVVRPIPLLEAQSLLNWAEFGQNEGYN